MAKVYVPLMRWRCTQCNAAGEVEADAASGPLVRWERVLKAHATSSPDCAGHAGIATEPITFVQKGLD